MAQTIVPILRYRDARAAIASLCDAFGFVELFSDPPSGAVVGHARLQLGTNQIMVGSIRADDGIESPLELGAATQGLCVYVDDVDAHFERARAAGATIVCPRRHAVRAHLSRPRQRGPSVDVQLPAGVA